MAFAFNNANSVRPLSFGRTSSVLHAPTSPNLVYSGSFRAVVAPARQPVSSSPVVVPSSPAVEGFFATPTSPVAPKPSRFHNPFAEEKEGTTTGTHEIVSATIPYNPQFAKSNGQMFMHGAIVDTRIFGVRPQIRYNTMDEGVRLPIKALQRQRNFHMQVVTNSERVMTSATQGLCCWYDTYEIDDADPIFNCPIQFSNNVLSVTGIFCSEGCVLKYAEEGRAGKCAKSNANVWLAMMRVWGSLTGPAPEEDMFIEPALHFSVLQKFGGPMSIREFRQRMLPRHSYPRIRTYVFPMNMKVMPVGALFMKEDLARPYQPPPPRPTAPPPKMVVSTTSTPSVQPFHPVTASPFVLGPPPPPKKRLRRIDVSDEEVIPPPSSSTSSSYSQTKQTFRRVEGWSAKRKRGGDQYLVTKREDSKRRKKALAKQLAPRAGGVLQKFLTID